MDLKVTALDKLLDYVASGIGSIAGSMMAPWRARQRVKAQMIEAKGAADILQIRAEAQLQARDRFLTDSTDFKGVLDITDSVNQKIQFQERKRLANTINVVGNAAELLHGVEVTNGDPDHDWTARFFNHVQDVSSEEMQLLWAKVLAGEVAKPGTTSLLTLDVLRNLDQSTARLFQRFCSICMFLDDGVKVFDARVPSFGGDVTQNEHREYGLGFHNLNRLNEHGLIISDYRSWFDYGPALEVKKTNSDELNFEPIEFQDRLWRLVPIKPKEEFKVTGIAMTWSGKELSEVIEIEPMPKFLNDLVEHCSKNDVQMIEFNDSESEISSRN